MSLADDTAIDYVFIDTSVDSFVVGVVELRSWGANGELLRDLRAKCEYYLSLVVNGRIVEMHPQSQGKRIAFRLVHRDPLTRRETTFIDSMRREHLDPAGIIWQQVLDDPHGV